MSDIRSSLEILIAQINDLESNRLWLERRLAVALEAGNKMEKALEEFIELDRCEEMDSQSKYGIAGKEAVKAWRLAQLGEKEKGKL